MKAKWVILLIILLGTCIGFCRIIEETGLIKPIVPRPTEVPRGVQPVLLNAHGYTNTVSTTPTEVSRAVQGIIDSPVPVYTATVPEGFEEGLTDARKKITLAIFTVKWNEQKWKKELYGDLEGIQKEVAGTYLEDKVHKVLADTRIGLELMDYGRLRSAIKRIDNIQEEIGQ